MYVPAPGKPLVHRVMRYAAWKSGEALVAILSAAKGFRLPDEPLEPFAHNLPMLAGTYERETLAAMREIVRPGMTVIDGGAHVGYFTRALSSIIGRTGKVLAFEMHPRTLELLRHNTRNLDNVEIIPAALGAKDGIATLYESEGLSSSNSITATKPGLRAAGKVPMRSIKSVLAERGIERADFIKLDIEGNEPAVLRGIDGPAAVIFEFKRYILESGGEGSLLADLVDRGFVIRAISGDLEAGKANLLALRPAESTAPPPP